MLKFAVAAPPPPIDENWARRIGAVYGEYRTPVCFN